MAEMQTANRRPDGLPEKMLALRLCGIGMENLRLKELPTPEPGPGQIVARVDAAMACASDNKVIDQGPEHPLMAGWDVSKYPIILGHEGSLTVASVGERVDKKFEVGMRCGLQPAIPCGPRHFRERYRENAEGISKIAVGYTLPGVFAEYMLITEEAIEEDCLIPLGESQAPGFGIALAEPLSCVVAAQQHSVHVVKDAPTARRRAEIGMKRGGVTVLLGAGPMGKMHVEMALGYRPRVVLVSDPIAQRREGIRQTFHARAEKQGTILRCVSPEQLPGELSRLTDGAGADDVICAVGIATVQEGSVSLLAKGGVTNLFGGTPIGKNMIQVDSRRIHYDSVSLVGSSGGDPSDIAEAVEAIAEGRIDPGNYVAKVGGLDAVVDLIQLVRNQEIEGKGVIYPQARAALRDSGHWTAKKEEAFLREHGRGTG
jgi:L-iditol 2-dehydrogenase